MNTVTQRYPLTWPAGWRRTGPLGRARAKFNHGGSGVGRPLEISDGVRRVLDELRCMGIWKENVIISSDLKVRESDGLPYANQPTSRLDPGVAVYWPAPGSNKLQRCMAVDRYDRIADNLAAVAATLEAMRAIERHGGALILDRAFMGFTALAAPEQWFTVLEVRADASAAEVDAAHRRLIAVHHPDRAGGDAAKAARINTARDDAYRINGWK